jgi:PKD repeat protein
MKKISTHLFLLCLIISSFSVSKIQAQNCFISLSQPIYGTNGNVAITGQASFPSGWNSNIDVNYGDGSINASIYNQTSITLNHTYIVNGNYTITAYIQAFNPLDTTQSCFSTAVINVSITNINTCNLQTSVNYFVVSQNTINIMANANMPVINQYLVIDGQQMPYADSTFYTFTQSGQHQICYYASSADSLNPCTDTACVIYDNTNNNTNCNLQVSVFATALSSNVAQIAGVTNSIYNYSFITIDGQQFSGVDTMTYTFNNAGQHQVCYYASYQDSSTFCSDSSCVIFNSNGGPTSCQASFYIWQDSLNTNTTVWLGINNSTGTPPLTYFWNFSDGSSSNQAYPVHVFNTPGNYVICLTITDANGCSSSMCDSSALLRLSQLAQIGSLAIYPPGTAIGLKSEEGNISYNVLPNPAEENSNLVFTSTKAEQMEVEAVNLLGASLFKFNVQSNIGSNNIELPTSTLSSGYFLLKLTKGKQKPIVLRLIKR